MLKKTLVIFLLLLFLGCSHYQPNHIGINIGYGKDPRLGDLSKVEKTESYNILDFAIEFIDDDLKKWSKSVELNIVDHKYNYIDDSKLKHATSYCVKGWLIRNYRFEYLDIFLGAGIGFGYINPTENNDYIEDSHFTSDLGIRTGIQKNFENFGIKLEYQLHHFSAIKEDDSGENEDEIRIGLVFKFD